MRTMTDSQQKGSWYTQHRLLVLILKIVIPIVIILGLAPRTAAREMTDSGDVVVPGNSIDDSYEGAFRFGDNCEGLDGVAEADLMFLLRSKHTKAWDKFCKIGEPDRCDDFSYVFGGIGFLVASREDRRFCQFVPVYEMYEWVPDFYHNFGADQFLKPSPGLLPLGAEQSRYFAQFQSSTRKGSADIYRVTFNFQPGVVDVPSDSDVFTPRPLSQPAGA